MSLVNGVVASVAGGALGAAAWAGVSYATEREIGWIAWGVGALAGYGMSLGLKGACDQASGVVAAVIALVSVFGGKYAAVHIAVRQALTEYSTAPIADQDLHVNLADRVVGEWEADGQTLTWPPGMTLEEADEPADYPEGVWAEAQTRFTALSTDERERMREDMGRRRAESLSLAESSIAMEGFKENLGPHDLLWGALALVTAFKLASKSRAGKSEAPAV